MPPKKLDPKDFRFLEERGARLVKEPGQVNGTDFLVDGCEDCEIVIKDHVAQIFVDYCKRCSLVVGPVASSAFLRNCEGCKIKIACGQLRTRDCVDCDLLVLVPGQPIIETSRGMRFGPLLTSYPEFEVHMEASGLARKLAGAEHRCRWSEVYDFSPGNPPGGAHWSCLSRREAEGVSAAFPASPDDVPVLDLYPRSDFPGDDGEAAVRQEAVAEDAPTAVPSPVVAAIAEPTAEAPETADSRLLAALRSWEPGMPAGGGADEVRAAVAGGASFESLEEGIRTVEDRLGGDGAEPGEVSGGGGGSAVGAGGAGDAGSHYRDLLVALRASVLRINARRSGISESLRIARERLLQGAGDGAAAHSRIWVVAAGASVPSAADVANKIEADGIGEICCIQTATVRHKPHIRFAIKRK